MNLLMKILLLPALRRKVHADTLKNFKKLLKTDLECRGIKKMELLTDHLLDRLITEAWRIAAEQEDDQIARNGKMYDAVEYVAEQTVLACKGSPEVAPFIRGILVHNGILKAE